MFIHDDFLLTNETAKHTFVAPYVNGEETHVCGALCEWGGNTILNY